VLTAEVGGKSNCAKSGVAKNNTTIAKTVECGFIRVTTVVKHCYLATIPPLVNAASKIECISAQRRLEKLPVRVTLGK